MGVSPVQSYKPPHSEAPPPSLDYAVAILKFFILYLYCFYSEIYGTTEHAHKQGRYVQYACLRFFAPLFADGVYDAPRSRDSGIAEHKDEQ